MSKCKLACLMPSYRGPELLKVSVPAILRSFNEDSKLYVVLNDADKESIEICAGYGVDFIATKTNIGTLATDLFLPILNCEYVGHINSDMIPSYGWDQNLIDIIKGFGSPCSASTQLVEPYGTNNPLVYIDNLGNFSYELEREFQKNYGEGKYTRESVVGYNHPIIFKMDDYKKVGGYSNNFDMRYAPLCYGLDDSMPKRLYELHNGDFKPISSGKDFAYHCISATNNKFDKGFRDSNNGMNQFQNDFGMTIHQFRNQINAFSKVELN